MPRSVAVAQAVQRQTVKGRKQPLGGGSLRCPMGIARIQATQRLRLLL